MFKVGCDSVYRSSLRGTEAIECHCARSLRLRRFESQRNRLLLWPELSDLWSTRAKNKRRQLPLLTCNWLRPCSWHYSIDSGFSCTPLHSGDTMNKISAVAEMGNRLATIDMGRKVGAESGGDFVPRRPLHWSFHGLLEPPSVTQLSLLPRL